MKDNQPYHFLRWLASILGRPTVVCKRYLERLKCSVEHQTGQPSSFETLKPDLRLKFPVLMHLRQEGFHKLCLHLCFNEMPTSKQRTSSILTVSVFNDQTTYDLLQLEEHLFAEVNYLSIVSFLGQCERSKTQVNNVDMSWNWNQANISSKNRSNRNVYKGGKITPILIKPHLYENIHVISASSSVELYMITGLQTAILTDI